MRLFSAATALLVALSTLGAAAELLSAAEARAEKSRAKKKRLSDAQIKKS